MDWIGLPASTNGCSMYTYGDFTPTPALFFQCRHFVL